MRGLVAVWIALAGCAAPDVDFGRSGVFACEPDADSPCENDGICAAGLCYLADEQPRVEIISPEVPAFSRYEPGASAIPVALRVVSNANFGSADPEDGPPGSLQITVDSVVVAQADSGDPISGLDIPVSITNTPGPHRIAVQLLRTDGTPYDNEAARARLAYFVVEDDQAYVAVTKPWPGDEIPGRTQQLDVEVATFNFEIVPAGLSASEGIGHVHMHYAEDIRTCYLERVCDARAAAIIDRAADNGVGMGLALFPSTEAESTTVSVVLRGVDHSPYLVPFSDCNVLEPPASCSVITDTIAIERTAD